MKFIIYAVFAIVCLDLAYALQCYTCLTPTPSDQCLVKKNCSPQHKWCESKVYGPTSSGYPFTGSRYVVRNCAEKCRATNPNALGMTKPVFCCSEDLCNTMVNGTFVSHGLMETQSNYYTVTAAAACSILTALRVSL